MKKILHVLSSTKYSGAENVATNVISSLKDSYEMIYVSPEGPIENILKEKNIIYTPLKKLSIANLYQVIRKEKPDVIHAHDFTATLISLIAGFKIPVVSHIHQNPQWLNNINVRSLLFLIASVKIQQIIAVTPAIKKTKIFSVFLYNKTTVLENIIDLKYVRSKAEDNSTESYDIVFIGRLVAVKNPIRFIEIIAKVVKIKPSIKVAIIGEGYLREESEKLIRELKLENNIKLLGFLSNPFSILKNSRLLCMTSKTEGLPMTAIESLALGKPVVVPNLVEMQSVIDENNGILCESDNEFVLGIIKLLNEDDTYYNMSKISKEKSDEMFDMGRYGDSFDGVYKKCFTK